MPTQSWCPLLECNEVFQWERVSAFIYEESHTRRVVIMIFNVIIFPFKYPGWDWLSHSVLETPVPSPSTSNWWRGSIRINARSNSWWRLYILVLVHIRLFVYFCIYMFLIPDYFFKLTPKIEKNINVTSRVLFRVICDNWFIDFPRVNPTTVLSLIKWITYYRI